MSVCNSAKAEIKSFNRTFNVTHPRRLTQFAFGPDVAFERVHLYLDPFVLPLSLRRLSPINKQNRYEKDNEQSDSDDDHYHRQRREREAFENVVDVISQVADRISYAFADPHHHQEEICQSRKKV